MEIERAEPRPERTEPPRSRVHADDGRRPMSRTARAVGPAPTAPTAPPTTAASPASPAAEPAAASPAPTISAPPPRPDRSAPATAGPPTVSEGSEAVWRHDFPDPHVIRANGTWWAFGTRVGVHAVPTLRSDDLVRWEWVGDALQGLPPWADFGPTWAPSVLARDDGFVLYYSVRDRASGLLCISRATAVLPQGPYVDRTTEPLVCQMGRGGSIDPSPFVDDDGRAWLLWKSEGTLDGEPTRLWIQELSEDGRWLVGPRHELLHRLLDWEFPIIEAPSMVRVDGRYHLLYSGNRWETGAYAVGHAVCDTVTGPCRRTAPHPVLASRDGAAGPGGQEVLRLPGGELALVHHAWDPAAVGYPHGARMLHVARLHVEGDRLVVGGPRREARPAGLLDIGR